MIGVLLYPNFYSLDIGEQFVHTLLHPVHVVIHDKATKARPERR